MQKMSEKEAIKILKNTPTLRYEELKGLHSGLGDAMRTAIQALEEIQKYRAIGTVAEINEMMANGWFTGVELVELAFMQPELKKYKAIGTLDQCREAVERMKPKKPIIQKRGVYDDDSGDWLHDEEWYMCPTCQMRNEVYTTWKRCHYCDQNLDWSE